MCRHLLAASTFLAAAAAGCHSAHAGLYDIQTYTYATADKYNVPVGITNSGLIVGTAARSSSSASTIDTSTSTAGPFTSFHPGTFTNVAANAVSASGLVAGNYVSGTKVVGFVYQLGTTAPSGSVAVMTITPTGSTNTLPAAVSANGAYVTGTYDAPSSQNELGFLYNGSSTLTLSGSSGNGAAPTGVNDSGTVVGTYQNAQNAAVGFIYSGGVYTDLNVPGAVETDPFAINDSGEVVGYDYDANGDTFGFTYSLSTGLFGSFSANGDPNTYVTGIDAAGDIIGYNGAGQGYVDVGGTISLLTIAGSSLVVPTSILNAGTITGDYETASGATDAFVATLPATVPEPATLALLGLPIVGILVRRRKDG